MGRFFLTLIAVALLASPAAAGRRCYRSNYGYGYTLQNSYSWPKHGACWSCHPKPAAKSSYVDWRTDMTRIAGRIADNADFEANFDKIIAASGRQVVRQGYAVSGGQGYSSIQGEYSSYPVQGQSLYGVQSYSTHPLIDLNAAFQTQSKLAGQLGIAAHATAGDAADLTSLAYQLESNRQTQIAAFSAIQSVAQGAPPQPTATQFRFNASVQPNGQIQVVPVDPQPQAQAEPSGNDGLLVLENRCASCHNGEPAEGKFSMKGQLTRALADDIERRINLPPEDPAAMPKSKTPDGHGPGEQLSARERNAVEDLLWSVGNE